MKTFSDTTKHLVAPSFGANKVWLVGKQFLQPILVRAEPEVIVGLLFPFERLSADGAFVFQFTGSIFGDVLLLAPVVPPFELAQVNIAPIHQFFDKPLHLSNVIWIGGSDELIVGQFEEFHGFSEFRTVQIGQCLRVHAFVAGRLLHFDAVLIGSRQEEHLIPGKPHGPRPSVTQGGGVNVPDVGPVVHVIDRGCDAA